MQLTDNTILITGGGSGIGAELAAALYRAGNRVIIAGRRREALAAVARNHPGMECVPLDLGDPESVHTVARTVADRHPELNVLVNNAGVMATEDLTAPDLDVIQAVCAINLVGPLLLTAQLLPTLRTRPHAAIVNVSSALAFVPMASLPTYCATKAALHSYTQSLRFQLRHSGIQVIEVAPPRVYTDGVTKDDARGVGVGSFVEETMTLLAADPSAVEIVVETARRLRFAAGRGDYEEAYAAVNVGSRKG